MQRRKFRPEFKLQCVLDVISGRKSPTQVCREHNRGPHSKMRKGNSVAFISRKPINQLESISKGEKW